MRVALEIKLFCSELTYDRVSRAHLCKNLVLSLRGGALRRGPEAPGWGGSFQSFSCFHSSGVFEVFLFPRFLLLFPVPNFFVE